MGVVCRQPVLPGEEPGGAILIAGQALPGSEPQRALAVLADRLHHRFIRKTRAAWNTKTPVVEDAEAAMSAHPETALTVLEHRQCEFVRQSVSHGVAGKFSISETAEPRMPCPDPESTRSVLIGCVGVAIDQPLLCGVATDRLMSAAGRVLLPVCRSRDYPACLHRSARV